jgi:cis-2,3-dihydrobiphenyl-2,3-diol dehydrogenase
LSRLSGHVAIITGGASGIGRAIAEAYVAEGAQVVVLDRNPERVDEMRSALGASGRAMVGDVRLLADNRAAVDLAVQSFGRLDIFVANAGIWDWNARLLDIPEERLDAAFTEIFDINVKGALLGARAAGPALAETGGSLVFTLSNASLYVNGGGPLYTASKHALLGLLRQAAFELAPRVRVNGVAIGGLSTNLVGPVALGQDGMAISAMPLGLASPLISPLVHQPRPADLTSPFIMLGSRTESAAMTGAIIEAHGGFGVRGIFAPAGGYHLDPAGDPTPAARAALKAFGMDVAPVATDGDAA